MHSEGAVGTSFVLRDDPITRTDWAAGPSHGLRLMRKAADASGHTQAAGWRVGSWISLQPLPPRPLPSVDPQPHCSQRWVRLGEQALTGGHENGRAISCT